MDTKTFVDTAAEPVKTSRLPAGSTLFVPGIGHVAHPEAEANLAGAGDTRLGDTKAVSEYVSVDQKTGGKSVKSEPLADEVKPKVVTTAGAGKGATQQDKHLSVEAEGITKTDTE